jgi:hypothetical protein
MLPQLELLEAAECCLLACTVAWDAGAASTEPPDTASEQGGLGCAGAAGAVAQALRVLAQLAPPAPEAAAAIDVRRLSEEHCPDWQQWQAAVGSLLQALEESVAPGHQPGAALLNMDLDLARQEFLQNGQQVGPGARAGGWGLGAAAARRCWAQLLATGAAAAVGWGCCCWGPGRCCWGLPGDAEHGDCCGSSWPHASPPPPCLLASVRAAHCMPHLISPPGFCHQHPQRLRHLPGFWHPSAPGRSGRGWGPCTHAQLLTLRTALQGLDELLAAMSSDPLAEAAELEAAEGQAQLSEGLSKVVLARCTTLQVGPGGGRGGGGCTAAPASLPACQPAS